MFSILVPTYNNLPYLKDEVQSLIMWLKDNPLC